MFEIVQAYKALPDSDTLQIAYFPSAMGFVRASRGGPCRGWYPEEKDAVLEHQRQKIRTHVDFVRNTAVVWLGQGGCQEGEGEAKKTTLRVIELGSHHPELMVLDSAEAEEYEV